MQITRITDLPDGLLIPGLPEELRAVPIDPEEWKSWRERVLRYRKHIRKMADADENVRRSVMYFAANDPAYYCCIFGIIYEPRWRDGRPPGWRPWIPYAFQVETFRWIIDVSRKTGPRGHGIVEKARDMGASWMCCLIAIHYYLFADAGDLGFSSRSQVEVDERGNPKSLFTKLRGLLTIAPGIEADLRLPDWLMPAGFMPRVHDKTMLMTHPSKPITIAGSTTTKNAGRGNRTTYWFNDEAAFNPYYGMARATQVSVTDHIFSVSSAGLDDGGAFKSEVDTARTAGDNPSAPGSSYLRLDWWVNPLNDNAWYEAKKAEMNDPYAFAREVEIDYLAGQGDWVYGRAHRIDAGDYPYLPNGGQLYCMIDPGLRDPTAIAYAQYDAVTGRSRWVKSILVQGMDARFIASLLVGVPVTGEGGYSMSDYAEYHDFMAWTRSLKCSIEYVGDPFGNHKGGDGSKTFYETLARQSHDLTQGNHYILVMTNYDKKANTYERRREALLKELPHMDFDREAETLLVAVQQSRYPEMREGASMEPLKPKHDAFSHFRSAAEYYAVHVDLYNSFSENGHKATRSEPQIVNLGGQVVGQKRTRDTMPVRRDRGSRENIPDRPGIVLGDIRADLR